jgi:hypothetical protein
MPYTLIMWAVVLCVLVPACLRSPGALILFTWWVVDMVVYYVIGDVPAGVDIVLDLVALGMMMRYACCYMEILALVLFMPALASHMVLSTYTDWLVSYWLGIAQFLLVGISAWQGNTWTEYHQLRRRLCDDISSHRAFLVRRFV